ncbi:hypothetical protein NXS19_010653 [Fusarium pseudograminearum]|nr:hypothetical protein NXS19_010653 [Fusarium pseudograminearum]
MKKSIACGACRSSKRKCIHSGGPPCTRCRDRGDECIFPPKGTSFIFRRSRLERLTADNRDNDGLRADPNITRAANLATTDPFGFLTDERKKVGLIAYLGNVGHHSPFLTGSATRILNPG